MDPLIGIRKVHASLSAEESIGRDALFDIAKRHNRLVKRRRRIFKTTQPVKNTAYRNLIKRAAPRAPEQVVVSDMTYIRLKGDAFAFAWLVTDLYSRKIVGYDLARTQHTTGAMRALRRALQSMTHPEGLIHHSDRGRQYHSAPYARELQRHGCHISMTEINHCYENAVAERVNGILKHEYYMNATFNSYQDAKLALHQAVWLYNHKRMHWSLDLKTPDYVHRNTSRKDPHYFRT